MQRVAQGWLVLTRLTHHDAAALSLTNRTNTIMQLLTDSAMRGRVTALRVCRVRREYRWRPGCGLVANHLCAEVGLAAALLTVFVLASRKETAFTVASD
jgi:hypothetical protein